MSKKTKYYAVRAGRKTGIFYSWDDCQQQIKGYPNAIYKSFETEEEAENYLNVQPDEQLINYESMMDYGPDEFIATSKAMPNVAFCFVDGSCLQDKGYSCGVAMFINGKTYTHKEAGTDPTLAKMNNVAGELLGAIRAVNMAEKCNAKEVIIFHDYEGIRAWPDGSWAAKNDATSRYAQFINSKRKIMAIKFVKVEGHTDIYMNEVVDKLAKAALGIS